MKLKDALFYWLQIKLVYEARPEDGAAKDTVDFFAAILREDHHVKEVRIHHQDDRQIHVEYTIGNETMTEAFDRRLSEQLLHDIEVQMTDSCLTTKRWEL